MFLTTPTIEELRKLDMPFLMDMLVYQTNLHVQLLRLEGVNSTTKNSKETIKNIQAVIEMKRSMEKNTIGTSSDISYTRDSTSVDPVS